MRHFAWFDCLRCAAILLVIVAHCPHLNLWITGPLATPAHAFQQASWMGVDLFFVLSGFLVSGLLFAEHDRTGHLDIKRFLIRRGFKIIPPFYALILITIIHEVIVRNPLQLDKLFHDFFFLQSYRLGSWNYAWTLSIEVHFYILLALLLYRLSSTPPKTGSWLARLPGILYAVLVIVFLARLINSSTRHEAFNVHREFWPTHLHLDVLAAGVLLRYLYNYHREIFAPLQRLRLLWIGLGLLLVCPSAYLWSPHPPVVTALIPTCNYLGFGLILFESTQIPFPADGVANWLVRPFDYIGKHSYSIYLWHIPVKDWLIDPLIKVNGPFYICCFFAGSLLVGIFFSVILEMPIIHLRNRLFPSATSLKS